LSKNSKAEPSTVRTTECNPEDFFVIPITNKYGITVTRRDAFIQEYYINDDTIEWNSLVAYSNSNLLINQRNTATI
jgi:hypothetical protein